MTVMKSRRRNLFTSFLRYHQAAVTKRRGPRAPSAIIGMVMHDEYGRPRGNEIVVGSEAAPEQETAFVDERYDYRLALVERCRDDLQRVLVPGEIAVILDPEDDSFAHSLCVMLGATGHTLTFVSIPAESLLAGLANTNAELSRALEQAPPVGYSWVVVIGRGSAGMALFPTVSSSLN